MKRLLPLALVLLLALPADAVSLRRQCRRQCKATITACVESGTRRARCRRTVLRTCRQDGLVACGAAGTTTTTTLAGGPTTTLPPQLNGCDLATAADLTGQPAVTVTFADFAYTPPCFRVSAGTEVTFSGNFTEHPLVGGQVDGTGSTAPDPTSPFTPPTTGGSSRAFPLPSAGAFPFYCDVHALTGMKGVAFVVP
jgi:plastocyanin